MATSSLLVLLAYGVLIVLASLAGGLVPLLVRLTHQRMQLALSFVAGAMLGVGILHLGPHAFLELRSIDAVAGWTLIGFLAMFFVERFFAFHHHDISEADAHEHHAGCELEHHHAAPMSASGAVIGLSLHGLADGLALAASVQTEAAHGDGFRLVGLATFLVILLHKPFDSLTLGTLLAAGGWSPRARHWFNAYFALLAPAGALLLLAGFAAPGAGSHYWLGVALAFSAGTFLCIASSDLLPELQFHQHDRGKLSVALLLGIAAAWAIGLAEGAGHGHSHEGPGHSHEAHDHDHGHDHGQGHEHPHEH
jgi:zinc and cadmium transporter